MIKKIIIVLALLFVGFLISISLLRYLLRTETSATRIDTSFATRAILRAQYNQEKIHVVITDANDIKTLKHLFTGWAYERDAFDHFSTDYFSVTMTNGRKSIMFCPLIGGYPFVETGTTHKCLHLSEKQQQALYAIFRKYGSSVPIK